MFGAILKCSKKAKVLEIITGIYAQENANIKVSSWLLKERSVFSVKKRKIKRYEKILKRVMHDQDFLLEMTQP